MNANTEALQHGANYWLLSTGTLLDLAENIKENNYEKESLDKWNQDEPVGEVKEALTIWSVWQKQQDEFWSVQGLTLCSFNPIKQAFKLLTQKWRQKEPQTRSSWRPSGASQGRNMWWREVVELRQSLNCWIRAGNLHLTHILIDLKSCASVQRQNYNYLGLTNYRSNCAFINIQISL